MQPADCAGLEMEVREAEEGGKTERRTKKEDGGGCAGALCERSCETYVHETVPEVRNKFLVIINFRDAVSIFIVLPCPFSLLYRLPLLCASHFVSLIVSMPLSS